MEAVPADLHFKELTKDTIEESHVDSTRSEHIISTTNSVVVDVSSPSPRFDYHLLLWRRKQLNMKF